ncbi:MAG: chorismate mutase [Ruminococcus sp.]|nr:chorismate mutase [Ruminococcus sp.]
MELNEIRTEIDALDQQLQTLFEQRMALCLDVAKYKQEHHMQIFQADREKQVLDEVEKRAAPHMAQASRTLFQTIMSISSQLQQKMLIATDIPPEIPIPHMETAIKVGCQGTAGANSETATQSFFPNRQIQFYPTFDHVFAAVESGELEYGVLPIYNSISGTVTQTIDLMHKYSFFITATNQVEVMHCLAALPGTQMDEIAVVYSHPQALTQCSDFLDARGLPRRDYSNTATAAQMVAEAGDKAIAAICSEEAARKNHLEVLAHHISNVVPNYTQFICITKDMQVAKEASVISVMLTLPNEPGSLSQILNKFLLYGLDLTKIESCPIQSGNFDVIFHIDFKGNLRDRSIAAFLNDLCKSSQKFKLLGNMIRK